MNATRNLTIKFFVNDKLDHVIKKSPGKRIAKGKATKKRRHIVKKGRRIA
jgi:hypothetical protein